MSAVTAVSTIETFTCGACGVVFGMTSEFVNSRRNDHQNFYCPNGHPRYFPGENELEKTKRMLDNANKRREWAEQDAQRAKEHAEREKRSAASYKGKLRSVQARVAVGLCPCCRRNFGNLSRHMETKHPDWKRDHRGVET